MTDPIHPKPAEFSVKQVQADPILRYFHYAHLPPALRGVSAHFCHLAEVIVRDIPRNAERSVALRKLLEAKDAAVRANVPDPGVNAPTFLDRLLEERGTLAARLEKLGNFIDTIDFFALPQAQQDLLREQVKAMQLYHEILEERVRALESVQPEHVQRGATSGETEPQVIGEAHEKPISFHS